MSENSHTTVSIDREETYPRLNDYRKSLDGNGPGESASFDDAIRNLLDAAQEESSAGEAEGAA